jgi:hypothetical protein
LFLLSMPGVRLLFKKNLCKVSWRLTLFLFNNPVISSAGIVGFVESEVLALTP